LIVVTFLNLFGIPSLSHLEFNLQLALVIYSISWLNGLDVKLKKKILMGATAFFELGIFPYPTPQEQRGGSFFPPLEVLVQHHGNVLIRDRTRVGWAATDAIHRSYMTQYK
jgi:hypothetical protein